MNGMPTRAVHPVAVAAGRVGAVRSRAALAAVGLALAALTAPAPAADDALRVPAPVLDSKPAGPGTQIAVFAGGCFWGVQKVYQHVRGVRRAVSGYAGGDSVTAQYEIVGSGRTGHAESVQIVFDPAVVSYGTLLRIFFSVAHDPTEIDRQGPDRGSQYRSEIFTTNDEQKRVADAYVAQLDRAGVFGRPIATRVEALPAFFAAENYHQDYATLHPDSRYIATYDLPKVRNLQRLFAQQYRADPVLVAAASAVGH